MGAASLVLALGLGAHAPAAVVLGGDLFVAQHHPSALASDDTWVVNLEGGNCARPGAEHTEGAWRLCSIGGSGLKTLGIDVVGLANNHARDGLDAWSPAQLGGLTAFDATKSVRVREGQATIPAVSWTLLGWHDENELAPVLSRVSALADDHQHLVVYAHRSSTSAERWRRSLRKLAQAGADIVVGHGGHRPGPIERVHGAVVLTDVGDLAMDCACSGATPASNTGLTVRLDQDAEGVARVRVQPVLVARKAGDPIGRPMEGDAAERLLATLQPPEAEATIVDGELVFAAGGEDGFVRQSPITWNEERDRLTREYRETHYGEVNPTSAIEPTIIVVHHTAIDSFKTSFNAFNKVRLTSRKKLQAASPLNVSAHFLVDRDGTVHQLLPETTMARHVIGLNWTAIGIENVGGKKKKLTKKQLDANARLVRWLKKRHPAITMMIGHHEYQRFRRSKLWKERDTLYLTSKIDPGDRFMRRLRAKVKGLELKAWPPDVSKKTDFSKGAPRELTTAELEGKSLVDLVLMRNEIFARHGYVFHKPWLLDHFSKQAWYEENPRYSDELLTELDRKNLKRILALENDIDTADLRILRNTVFARRGRKFKSPDLQEHFARQPWYKPDPKYTDRRLTRRDKLEIKVIQEREKAAAAVTELDAWKPGRKIDRDRLINIAQQNGVFTLREFLRHVLAELALGGFEEVGCDEEEDEICRKLEHGTRKREELPPLDRKTLKDVEMAFALALVGHDQEAERMGGGHCECWHILDEQPGDETSKAFRRWEKRLDACEAACVAEEERRGRAAAKRFRAEEAKVLKGRHAGAMNLLQMDIQEIVAA